jgi:hypothetical protein
MQSEMSRGPGRLKPPEVPTSLDRTASHRDEVKVVLDMLDVITATTKDVIREEARFFHTDANICEEAYRDQCYHFNREKAQVHLRWPEYQSYRLESRKTSCYLLHPPFRRSKYA